MGTGGDTLALLTAVAAFVVVACLWAIAQILWTRRRSGEREVIARRLGAAGAPDAAPEGARTLRLWHEGREAILHVAGARGRPTFGQRFERLCREAGWSTPARRLLAGVAGASLAAGLLLLAVTGRLFPSVVGAGVVPLLFSVVARKRAAARERVFERQLVEALELSARSLRAGHPLLASFQLIAEEVPVPVGEVFAGIVQQQAMGVPLEDSLRRAAGQCRSQDLDLFAAALSIHARTGGNLADVMHSLALVIRERMRLGRRFRVLVAQTQVSKRILIAMPCVMFGVLNLMSPEYMGLLYSTSAGQFILMLTVGSLLLGWFVMNKMADLRT